MHIINISADICLIKRTYYLQRVHKILPKKICIWTGYLGHIVDHIYHRSNQCCVTGYTKLLYIGAVNISKLTQNLYTSKNQISNVNSMLCIKFCSDISFVGEVDI